MSANKIPRGRPSFASTQREEVLQMLRAAGRGGVSRYTLIYEKHISQCGARVDELKRVGYAIHSELRDGERYVRYVLDSEPLELNPLRAGGDSYEQKYGPRPSGKPQEQPYDDLPLFTGMRR